MRTKCLLVAAVLVVLIACTYQYPATSGYPASAPIPAFALGPQKTTMSLASDDGAPVDMKPYFIIEMPNSSIPARGRVWSAILNSSGIVSHVFTIQQIMAKPTLLQHVPAALLDASLGSANGSQVSSSFMHLLVSCDVALVLTGRAAWLLHSLRGTPLGSVTATASQRLLTAQGYEAAIFLSSPIALSVNSALTEETNIQLPVDQVQGEHSRIVNLTGAENPTSVAALRYDSYPLDTFLFGPDDPSKLTDQGRGLLVNTISFAVSLRETLTTQAVSQLQAPSEAPLAGGYHYPHEPTLKAAYAAVHSVKSALDASNWSSWSSQHQSLIEELLDSLFIDYGSQAGFMNSVSENTVGLQSTAEGLWLAASMGLLPRYHSDKIVSYLASREDAGGGFANDIATTYLVVESLGLSGNLGSINTVSLESWLRSCIIDGSKTSNPDLWGAVGQNPNSTAARTSYAAQYVLSLQVLGKTHGDPLKLTSWIKTRMSNGDGSYMEVLGSSGELVTGTSSALTAMAIMNTLSAQNRTTGLSWLAFNQLPSGGFGLTVAATDNVGKTWPTLTVALCIQAIGQQSESMARNVISFVSLCETDMGFEAMEPIPSLMWSDWLASISRLSHSEGFSDSVLAEMYAVSMRGWSEYPGNVTAATSIEYGPTQYRMQSVWTQYFGAATYSALGSDIPDSAVSAAESYLYQCQDSSGHYKPTSFMGTPQMQYTVAAVEALYLMNALNTIRYRTSLGSAILAEFRSGHWSMDGWTLRPFTNQQSAIDWLCTRAAVRLGILDSAKALQIVQSIKARIQYSDIWALSRDVATLALLNASGFQASLGCINTQAVIQSLGSTPFSNGWLNSTDLWQPVYTAGALEMISILGLRARLANLSSGSIHATGPSTGEISSSLNLMVSISPLSGHHSVLVFAFGNWLLFRNVGDNDSIELTIPSVYRVLGPSNISVMLRDFGVTKAYSIVPLQVRGVLQGSLQIAASRLPRGHNVNGSVVWSLEHGLSAGQTHAVISLGDGILHQQWEYSALSPLSFSIPSSGFPNGVYNLTVRLDSPYCQNLNLTGQVALLEPVETYISAPAFIQGNVNATLSVPWSLRYSSNGSKVQAQQVRITIKDQSGATALNQSGVLSPFTWAPSQRGNYSFILSFSGHDSLEGSYFAGAISIYENTRVEWLGVQVQNQYSSAFYVVKLSTQRGVPLSNRTIQVTVTSPSSAIVLHTQMITNSTGFVKLSFSLNENGIYLLDASFSDCGFLIGCAANQGLVSWSSSSLVVGGATPEALVQTPWNLWAQLSDSGSAAVAGAQVTVRIIFLPSTVVVQQTLTTNLTGYVMIHWSGNTAGTYRFEAEFNATLSRGHSISSVVYELRIPLVLVVTVGDNPQVGQDNWIELSALDYRGSLVTGLTVAIVVRGSTGQVAYQTTLVTQNGSVRVAWRPSNRGVNTILATAGRQNWYESAEKDIDVAVMESPQVSIEIPTSPVAPGSILIAVTVRDQNQSGIPSVLITVAASIDGQIILTSTNLTSSAGESDFLLLMGHPGTLSVNITCPTQGWLIRISVLSQRTVLGLTSLSLTSPGQPVKQGSLAGIVATLTDYSGNPIIGAQINFIIGWPNGTICASASRTTGASGKCSLAYTFNTVGDFVINASFAGAGLQAPSSQCEPQRVYVIPTVVIVHDPSYVVGQSIDLGVGLRDALGYNIAGRSLLLRISNGNQSLFQTQIQTADSLAHISWTPTSRGQMTILVVFAGDTYYLANSTTSPVSIMELATGTLLLSAKQIDMFGTVQFQYSLTSQGSVSGITVHFQVLDVNLVPVWTFEGTTNSSGIVMVSYAAQQAYGILMVQAEPETDECLLGAGTQKQLIVVTNAQLSVEFEPEPPCAGNEVDVSIRVQDELGLPIDGISLVVKIYDPYGQQVKLGSMSMSVTLQIRNGTAQLAFTPQYSGLYTLDASSSGSVVVHTFQSTTLHTVYSLTSLTLFVQYPCMEVGTCLSVSVRLADHNGVPMIGRTITMQLNGPGGRVKGPIDSTTNATGYGKWIVQMDEIGLWKLEADFAGIGVYLAASASAQIDVRYATVLEASLASTSEIVAGKNPAQLRILLSDSGGTPLEGFSIHYEVYHESIGLCIEGDIIQVGQSPLVLNLALPLAGNYTTIVSFAGTIHYLPSSAAVSMWARGTTNIRIQCPARTDRSENSQLVIGVFDESGSEMSIEGLGLQIQLTGSNGSITLTGLSQVKGSELIIRLRGFALGDYHLTAAVPDSRLRLGCSAQFNFTVYTAGTIIMKERAMPGVLGRQHSVVFLLVDSLGDAMPGMTVFVSLYDPKGREIYGSPLTTRTPVLTSVAGTRIEWTPSELGNYTLVLAFEGDSYRLDASEQIVILTRYESNLDLMIPSQITYGDALSIQVTLSGPTSRIQGAQVVIIVSLGGIEERQVSVLTDLAGRATVSIQALGAGNHTVLVAYGGSSTFNACTKSVGLAVLPVVSMKVTGSSDVVLGFSCTLTIEYQIAGLGSDWTGTLIIVALGPDGSLVSDWTFRAAMNGSQPVTFLPEKQGVYHLNVTFLGLPVLGAESKTFAFSVTESSPIRLDESTVPIVSEIGIVAGVALFLSRRLKRMESLLPGEWES